MARVYEIANKLGMPSRKLMDKLQAAGVSVKSHMSSVDERVVTALDATPKSAVPLDMWERMFSQGTFTGLANDLIQRVKDGIYSTRGEGNLVNILTDAEVLEKFFRWQYVVATGIAEAYVMVPWVIEIRNPKTGEWEVSEQHELNALFNNVNPIHSGPELFYQMGLDLMMVGKHYWEILPDPSEAYPQEIWFKTGAMTPVFQGKEEKGILKEWLHKIDPSSPEEPEHIPADRVVYLRLPKAKTLLGGMGPIQAAGSTILVDEQLMESWYYRFRNGIHPTATLTMEEGDPEKREQLLEKFNQRYQAAKESGMPIGIGSGMSLQINDHNPEMGFEDGERRMMETIFAAARYPKALVGIADDFNRSNIQGVELIFQKWNMAPKLILAGSKINQDLVEPWYGRDVRFRFITEIPEDQELLTERAPKFTLAMIWSPNEARKKVGDPPRMEPEADMLWAPLNMLPITTAAQNTPSGKGKNNPDNQGYPASTRSILSTRFEIIRDRLLPAVETSLKAIFTQIGADVLGAWDTIQDRENMVIPQSLWEVLNKAEIGRRLRVDMAETNIRSIHFGGEFAKALRGSDVEWSENSEAVSAYLMRFSRDHYETIGCKVVEDFVADIYPVLEEGNWESGRKLLQDWRNNLVDKFSEEIAERETTSLLNAGGQAFRDQFEAPFKQWVTHPLCERHEKLDGVVIQNDAAFETPERFVLYPGDINDKQVCRCLAVAL